MNIVALAVLIAWIVYSVGFVRATLAVLTSPDDWTARRIIGYTIVRIGLWPVAWAVDYWNANLKEGW